MRLSDHRSREATDQTVFREMNEWTADAWDGADHAPDRLGTYICECSDSGCTSAIRMTRTEYEAIRAQPVRFAVAVDHEDPEIGVLAENARFATVEKIYGPAIEMARATDPRR